ncbi:MAG: 4-alpha-glucanotransferase, partial [Synechococcales cyanobacterium]
MPRGSGILLHPSSFPSPYGIGDFGSSAYRFIDFLMSSHQHYWQILPMGPTGYGNSPYLAYSVFAGNHLLISPELLEEQGWLDKSELANSPDFPLDHIDFDGVIAFKDGLFRLACARFRQQATPAIQKQFEQFCIHQSSWLDDYS